MYKKTCIKSLCQITVIFWRALKGERQRKFKLVKRRELSPLAALWNSFTTWSGFQGAHKEHLPYVYCWFEPTERYIIRGERIDILMSALWEAFGAWPWASNSARTAWKCSVIKESALMVSFLKMFASEKISDIFVYSLRNFSANYSSYRYLITFISILNL